MSKQETKVALIYDFDGTLAPGNMQDGRFIPEIGMTAQEFWDEVNRNTEKRQCDPTISYMFVMLEKAAAAGVSVRREDLAQCSSHIEFFPGVPGWFGRMNRHGESHGVRTEHYIVSSGNSEIIEATPIAHEFHGIFASKFIYDEHGLAIWPANVINFTTKTQYLFRVNKGAHGPNDRDTINLYVPDEERPIPFENIVYIGDGETDVPCFRLVKDMGGLAVAVHPPGRRHVAERFLREGRVNAVAESDYREGSHLDLMIQAFLEMASVRRKLNDRTRETPDPGNG